MKARKPVTSQLEPWARERSRALAEARACQCWLLVSEDDARELLKGTVPAALIPQLQALTDWVAEGAAASVGK